MSGAKLGTDRFGRLVPFNSYIAADGYRWVDGPAGEAPARYLVPIPSTKKDVSRKPLDEPALHRRFAALSHDETAFLGFANAYGQLGALPAFGGGRALTIEGRDLPAEHFLFWAENSFWMKQAVRLWDALRPDARPEDRRMIEEWIRLEVWRESGDDGDLLREGDERLRIVFTPAEGTIWGQHRRFVPDGWARFGDRARWPKSAEQAAVLVLSNVVNFGLQNTRARLWEVSKVRTRGVPLVIGSEPYNLIGALWLQLALAIEGNLTYKPCERCGQWYHVPPRARFNTSRFCSNSCRFMAYRDRKTEAQRLAAEGVTPKQISVRMGWDLGMVKKWIREAKTEAKLRGKGR